MKTLQSGVCRICGCTDTNCDGCVRRSGRPCSWVDSASTLCSACVTADPNFAQMGLRSIVDLLPADKRYELAARCVDVPLHERLQLAVHHVRGMRAGWHPGIAATAVEIRRDLDAGDVELRDDCALMFLIAEWNRALLEVFSE